jgi:hypothetical protein
MGNSIISKILMIGMTIIFEFSKGISFFEFLSGKHKKSVSRLWLLIWLILTGFSLFASTAFSINETNKSQNESYITSNAHQNSIDEKERLINLISKKEEQIDKAVDEKESTIKQMEKERDAFPETYINTRQEATEKITEYSNEQQDKIDKYNNELEELNEKLDKKSNTISDDYEAESTTGYISILNKTADLLNESKLYINSKWSFEKLELLFYFLLSFTLEIVICLFYYLKKHNEANSETDSNKLNNNENIKLNQSNKNSKVYRLKNAKLRLIPCLDDSKSDQSNENSAVKKIDIKKDSTNNESNFTEEPENVKQYLNYVYKNKRGNISPGQKKINDITGLSFRQIKNIRDLLEEKGILTTDNKITSLLIDNMDEAMKKLDLEEQQ